MRHGFGIFKIENLVPSFDTVYGGVFYSPNILSYGLAALMCPIKPDIVLYGLANKDLPLACDVIRSFGVDRVRIISSNTNKIRYMDELNVMGKSRIFDSNVNKIEEYNFGTILNMPNYDIQDIKQMQSIENNVKIVLDIISGKRDDAYVDLVCLNSGNILQLSGIVDTIEEGYYISKKQIESGKTINKLIDIVQESKGDISKLENYLYKVMR